MYRIVRDAGDDIRSMLTWINITLFYFKTLRLEKILLHRSWSTVSWINVLILESFSLLLPSNTIIRKNLDKIELE